MGKSFPFYNTTIGFDRLFDELARNHTTNQNFPPHNIVKHTEENYCIELAVAGYDEKELEVSYENGILTVESIGGLNPGVEYLYKGISSKSFVKQFTLADDVIVDTVDLTNGILTIRLNRIIPEEKKPRVIPINGDKKEQIYLNEGI